MAAHLGEYLETYRFSCCGRHQSWKWFPEAKYYVKNSGGKIRKTSGKVTITYANGYSKRVGFLRNPIVYPDSEIFVSFRPDKPPFADRLTDTVNRTLERIIMFSTLATTTLTTIFLVKNLKD